MLGCAHAGVWSISYKRNHNFVWVALLVFQKHLRHKCLLNCKFPLLFYVVCNESNFYANLNQLVGVVISKQIPNGASV